MLVEIVRELQKKSKLESKDDQADDVPFCEPFWSQYLSSRYGFSILTLLRFAKQFSCFLFYASKAFAVVWKEVLSFDVSPAISENNFLR